MRNTHYDRPHLLSVLIAATLAGVAWLGIRIVMTGSIRYGFLIWNLLLAWIPFAVSHPLFCSRKKPSLLLLIPVLSVWLLFFPNAPYMLTDFIHIPRTLHFPESMEVIRLVDWADLLLLCYFVALGYWLGLESLLQVGQILRRSAGRAADFAMVPVVAFLSGIAIYIGRFERLNSWDIMNPDVLAQGLAAAFAPKGLIFSVTFGVFLMVSYGLYRYLRTPAGYMDGQEGIG